MAKNYVSAERKNGQLKEFEEVLNKHNDVTGLCYVVETEGGLSVSGLEIARGGLLGAMNLAMTLIGDIGKNATDKGDGELFEALCKAASGHIAKMPELVAQAKAGEQVDKSKLSEML